MINSESGPVFHHYYHIYADGDYWREAVLEHLESLKSIDVPYRLVIGIVGSETSRSRVRSVFASNSTPAPEIHQFDTGWEQQTLQVLQDEATRGVIDGPVLYAHTKGAANKSIVSDVWRSCMEDNTVRSWKQALSLLENNEADTVGAHWLDETRWEGEVSTPFYGGNYWWSSINHIRSLPPIKYGNRWDAECWLGTVKPDRPFDTLPSHIWPGDSCNYHVNARTD